MQTIRILLEDHFTFLGLKSLALYCYTIIELLTTHHSYVKTYLEAMRGYRKKVTEVKECYAVALATPASINSQPTYFDLPYKVALPSRDGIIWLLRHDEAPPPLNTGSFHTRMPNNLDEMFIEASDLPFSCFYSKCFQGGFQVKICTGERAFSANVLELEQGSRTGQEVSPVRGEFLQSGGMTGKRFTAR